MSFVKICLICFIFLSADFFSQKKFVAGKDVFGTRVFIENKGQFNSSINSVQPVKFAYESSNEHVYFTDKGPVYKLVRRFPLDEEEMEKTKRGKKSEVRPDKILYVNVNWINSNPNIQIVESEKQNHYFTYGGPQLNSNTFKKITYKNVYNNIDFEYTIPDNKTDGIKYSVILHPGANPTDIQISYSGDVQKIAKRDSCIVIKTSLEDIIEHPPISYYENEEFVKADFQLKNNIISFSFPNGIQSGRKIIIDPWVTTITTLLPDNYSFDVDYDFAGNLFVYGGINQTKLAKYDPLGNLLWTFSGVIPSIAWTTQGSGNMYIGNFMTHHVEGKSYLGQGYEPANGARVVRLDAAGNYDNFTTPILMRVEVWDFGFHCPSNTVYEIGGATITNLSAGIVNQITGTVQVANFTGIPSAGQDVISAAVDNQNNKFVIMASGGTPSVDNKMLRINNTFNGNVWIQPSTYLTFSEAANKGSYVGGIFLSNGFNCLAVNDNYLFYYDGFNIAAYDKNTGIKIGFSTIGFHVPMEQGGIAVDECNNVYVGSIDMVMSYNFNGTNFISLPGIALAAPSPNKYVYDIKLDKNSKKLYVCGSGFAGVYSASNSTACGAASPFSVSTGCTGFNNGSAVATLSMGIANPTISYIWSNGGGTVAATMSTSATSNTVNLPNGTYTLQTLVNEPCGPTYTNLVNVLCCGILTVTPAITQSGCSNPVNSATLSISGGGTVTPTVTWSPAPASVGPGSLTANGLPIGTTTITVNNGVGCNFIYTITVLPPAPPVTFSINNLTGSNTITCINPTINLQAVTNYTYGTISYSWASPSFTANTATVAITAANTLTVTGTDLSTGCLFQQTVAIGIFTNQPTNSVNPSSQFITCNSGPPVTFSGTVSNPTINIQHDWYSPLNPLPGGVPIATSNNTISILSGSLSPGIYTLQTTNLVNGCKAFKTVTITSLDAWPTFSINSATNFSIGCSPLNQTTISIVNPVSTQSPPATCSYTFLPPSFAGVVSPSVVLGSNASTVTQIPGTWTLIVQDNSNFCRTQLSVPIIQNTVAPNVSANLFTQTLTCYNPTVMGTGTSTTANTQINWGVPSNPPLLSTSTLVIGPPNGPNTSTTSLTYATYTVIATNTVNACASTSIVIVNQNFRPPVSSPTISIGTPTAIYCNAGINPAVLTTGSSTTTSGGGPLAFVANPCWEGPSPMTSTCGPSSYSCYVPGIYSLTIMDNYNGCTKTATINVLDRTQKPVITNPVATAILDCGADAAGIVVALTGTSTGGVKYWYVQYPQGAAFSPTNAIVPHGSNPILNGTTSASVNVSMSGMYLYVVTNTLTGCHASGSFNVKDGDISADFIPDPIRGYAPLFVSFTNNSSSSLGSGSITSTWSFGNGTAQTTTSNISINSAYSAPGTYTAMLIASKGSCLDTAYKIIKVDLPSKMDVPNVFTPNGDGSNDVYFFRTANMSEINAVIFDRWGNKIYEVTSATGNVAWDGKNLQGKECDNGVYFYFVNGKGKDSKEYETKGNVSLFR